MTLPSLTAVAGIILGMGMTTTAVYITVAALIVPSLINIGVEPIAAHMFAFYFGVVSTITPPVALASFAGAAMARRLPWRRRSNPPGPGSPSTWFLRVCL